MTDTQPDGDNSAKTLVDSRLSQNGSRNPALTRTERAPRERRADDVTRCDVTCLQQLVVARDTYALQRMLIAREEQDAVNARDDAGRTALHVAVLENCLQVNIISLSLSVSHPHTHFVLSLSGVWAVLDTKALH